MVMRITLRSSATEAGPVPHPRYGEQFNYRAVTGASAGPINRNATR
jgi:hypothetical protein